MNPLFRFERKIGWPEVIAVAALAVSALAAWYTRAQVMQNLPDLVIESQDAIRIVQSDGKPGQELVAILPFVVTNRGGRAATLVKLEREDISPLLRVVNDKVTEDHGLVVSFALLEGTTSAARKFQERAADAEVRRFALPHIVNETIDSGRAKPFMLLLRMKDSNGGSLSNAKVFFACRAVFSDGTKYRLAQGFGFEQR